MDTLETAEPLAAFRDRLCAKEAPYARVAIDQAQVLLEQLFVDLPAKQAAGADPLALLEDLRCAPPSTEGELGRRLLHVFAALGEGHTHCDLPAPFADRMAYLPFVAREIFDGEVRRLGVVASAADGIACGDFVTGWNGQPVEQAVLRHAASQRADGEEARRAQAVQSLTFRPLLRLPLPPEDHVVLDVVSARGAQRTLRIDWRVAKTPEIAVRFASLVKPPGRPGVVTAGPLWGCTVRTPDGAFGYLRVRSFHKPWAAFVADALLVLAALPGTGLILDLRGCQDGLVQTGERMLQLFTSRRIRPRSFRFRVTPLLRMLAGRASALRELQGTIERAALAGRPYSDGHTLTSEAAANDVGRRYSGPVAVITDALTFSTAAMFVSSFRDHEIGPVLGEAPCIGGGITSPWPQQTVFRLSARDDLRPMPGAPSYRVAVQRGLREGAPEGGLVPDFVHRPTAIDLLEDDAQLLARAGAMLTGAEGGA